MATLLELARACESRDRYSAGHSARVALLATVVAERLGWDGERIDLLQQGAALHDIGKLVVSERVLRKEGPLDENELAEIRAHPEAGARMVELMRPYREAARIVLCHHERWDGGGYPSGVAGEEIPAEARVLAVVDAFDAMTSDRPYRRPRTGAEAVAELERCAGSQFDPEIVQAFVSAWREHARGELPRSRGPGGASARQAIAEAPSGR